MVTDNIKAAEVGDMKDFIILEEDQLSPFDEEFITSYDDEYRRRRNKFRQ